MNGVNYNKVVITLTNNSCMIVEKKGTNMGEFLFWVILIPLLFYIVISTFSKETTNDNNKISDNENYGDE